MKETELKPCPICNGEITIYISVERGVFARCKLCKNEYDVCDVDKVPTYDGVKIRKSTVRKIEKIWNRRADDGRK